MCVSASELWYESAASVRDMITESVRRSGNTH